MVLSFGLSPGPLPSLTFTSVCCSQNRHCYSSYVQLLVCGIFSFQSKLCVVPCLSSLGLKGFLLLQSSAQSPYGGPPGVPGQNLPLVPPAPHQVPQNQVPWNKVSYTKNGKAKIAKVEFATATVAKDKCTSAKFAKAKWAKGKCAKAKSAKVN